MSSLTRKQSRSACSKKVMSPRRRTKHQWLRWIFPITGLLALIWFLIRVVPKPSRATYPCQRVTFPLASGFIVWLIGLLGSFTAFRKAKHCLIKSRYTLFAILIAAGIGSLWLAMGTTQNIAALADSQTVNTPIGTAEGVHPGRVVWIHDPNATYWDGYYSPEHWYDSNHTDQEVVNKMVSRAIRGLAGESTDAAAWDEMFRHFNQSRGKGDVGYSSGEKIAIKINNTLSFDADTTTFEQRAGSLNKIDNSPQMTIALLWHLVNVVGVNESDITIGDPTRITPNFYYDIVHAEFPNVVYMARLGGFGRTQTTYSDVEFHWSTPDADGKTQDYIPSSFAEADYFMNFAILKSHSSGGITVCAKNHYGSLIRTPAESGYYDLHPSLPATSPGMGNYRSLVDLMGHPQLGGKTLLYIVDGLFAGENWDSFPLKWNMEPFNGDWPSSVFMSMDPVAIDSVCFDFLYTEWTDYPHISGADDYLHEAALVNDPCSGTFYDPNNDGLGLESLGVHEHWNNSIDKQYSSNLGTGVGIELTAPIPADLNGDGKVDFQDLMALTNQWLQNSEGLSADIFPYPNGDKKVNVMDFSMLTKYWGR